jgi:hypothetical protein
MTFINEYSEDLQAVAGVLLVGLYLMNWIPIEAVVSLAPIIGATATATIKSKLKKAGKLGDNL